MKRNLLLSLIAVLSATGLLSGPRDAHAELIPDFSSYGVYEASLTGGEVLVGQVFSEGSLTAGYVEHWVLYPGYVYPTEANGMKPKIRPGLAAYRDTIDFLARVPWAPGSRYVRVACADGTSLPGR